MSIKINDSQRPIINNKKEEQPLSLDNEQIEIVVQQYKSINTDDLKRREHGDKEYSIRDVFQRDYARILYSPSFRRLQGKMQIMGIKSDAFYRNRLTHSLEVAQIARSIATLLSETCKDKCKGMYKDDIYVLDAAALAHDIGHPAFGHKGERVLDEIAKKSGMRFEGNAQNFRVLRKLEIKDPNWQGLNLTYRTLLAINKYIISEYTWKNKFMYQEDYEFLDKIRKESYLTEQRTLDVQIIEIADDIAYAVHDLEDGLALKKFNIDEILFTLKLEESKPSNENNEKVYDQCKEIIDEAKDYANRCQEGNIQEYSKIFRLRLTSLLTDTFVRDITLKEITKEEAMAHGTKEASMEHETKEASMEHETKEKGWELSLKNYRQLLKLLKKSVFTCSTRDTDIQEYERKGEIIINTLYNIYSDPTNNKDGMLLPPNYRGGASLKENSINYIAGMMDTFAISMFEEHTGISFDKIDLSSLKK